MLSLVELESGPKGSVVARMAASGRCGFLVFLQQLDRTSQVDFQNLLACIAEWVNTGRTGAGTPRWDLLRSEFPRVEEWRTRRNGFRVLWHRDGRRLIISHGLPKKCQKTPQHEIDKCVALARTYHLALGQGQISILRKGE